MSGLVFPRKGSTYFDAFSDFKSSSIQCFNCQQICPFVGTAKIQAGKISETHNDGSETLVETKNIGKSFKDFPVALLVRIA